MMPSAFTRREILRSGASLTATAMPIGALATNTEERTDFAVHRLADELSDALARYRGGRWYVEIHAASMVKYSVRFLLDPAAMRDPSS